MIVRELAGDEGRCLRMGLDAAGCPGICRLNCCRTRDAWVARTRQRRLRDGARGGCRCIELDRSGNLLQLLTSSRREISSHGGEDFNDFAIRFHQISLERNGLSIVWPLKLPTVHQ